jgi:hypothetical protein
MPAFQFEMVSQTNIVTGVAIMLRCALCESAQSLARSGQHSGLLSQSKADSLRSGSNDLIRSSGDSSVARAGLKMGL